MRERAGLNRFLATEEFKREKTKTKGKSKLEQPGLFKKFYHTRTTKFSLTGGKMRH